MNLNWLSKNIIYITLGGSQAYGLNNELSDVDIKGICVPPRKIEDNLFQNFEQAQDDLELENRYSYLKNPKNPKFESTVYSLKKFFILASNVNPNIIEMLWTDNNDQFVCHPIMQKLLDNKFKFLSSKAKFTFSGYAYAQLAKIERHRKWIVQGEVSCPVRSDFGLPAVKSKGLDELFGYIKTKVEEWNLNQFSFNEKDRSELKETIWDLVWSISQKKVGWDNWPDAYAQGVVNNLQTELTLKDEVIDLIQKERAYAKAHSNYSSWIRWKNERNPDRRALEVKSGFDTKHVSHLVRLLRMGHEIITEGKVIVKRPDREEILYIKNGGWSYDQVMEYTQEMQSKLDDAYAVSKVLPRNVNFEELNELYYNLVSEYHNEN
jgi:uncharacterized protein